MEKVHVEKVAVESLMAHLEEIGRLGGIGSRRVEEALRRAVGAQWGTAKIPQFVGEHGVTHWVVDLSDALGGNVYYALVTRVQGEPVVVGVMSEEQAEERLRRLRPKSHLDDYPTQAEMGIDSENPNGLTPIASSLAEQRDKALADVANLRSEVDQLTKLLQEKRVARNKGPVLVRWKKPEDDKGAVREREERIRADDVTEMIQSLLLKGVRVEDIEVWSDLRRPQVSVSLVSSEPVPRGAM